MEILITCTYNLNKGLQGSNLQESVREAVEATTFFWSDEGLEVKTVPSPSPSVGFFSLEKSDPGLTLDRIYGDLSGTFCQWDLPVEQFKVEPA